MNEVWYVMLYIDLSFWGRSEYKGRTTDPMVAKKFLLDAEKSRGYQQYFAHRVDKYTDEKRETIYESENLK